MNVLTVDRDFSALSLRDLLDARDFCHVHLLHKSNVIATALGRYLIRKDDPWPSDKNRISARQDPKQPKRVRVKRTLATSEVRPYSWPCILVFVDQWVDADKFGVGGTHAAEDMVPPTIYLPDGRSVPVCVVEAPRQERVDEEPRSLLFPDRLIGGGFPLLTEVQGVDHFASVGCLVSDGHFVYALTNRHVAGKSGERIYSMIGGERVEIGKSSSKQLTRKQFTDVYPGFPGRDTFVNIDVGLIEITNRECWTAQIYGIGEIGELADLSVSNISLRLIGAPVRAFGAASGPMHGAIHALFYRYKSVAGADHVSDFLIGSRGEAAFATHPGDSGTAWMLETDDASSRLLPLALQWGGHVLLDRGTKTQCSYALASSLSTVCNLLEVDIVRDWNIGQSEYWGEMGHYTVGAKACEVVSEPGLKILMTANHNRIGFPDAALKDQSKYEINQAHYKFVPLADVADNVWRITRPADGNNHFADMDVPGGPGPFAGKTLLDLSTDPDNVDAAVWAKFYASLNETRPGALPLRVWQFYDEMIASLNGGKNPDLARFVCAAGCLAHYVGDACQPLHISRFHHNKPDHQSSVGKKVHSIYETTMLNDHAKDVVDGVNARIQNVHVTASFAGKGGKGAALRVIRLMRETITAISPSDICDVYNTGHNDTERVNLLWQHFGNPTMDRLAEGIKCLADVWESAWKEGGGPSIPHAKLHGFQTKTLSDIYRPSDFVVSKPLSEMAALLH